MKILVIGGAGYIGSHVAREFLDNNHQVVIYDNLSTGRKVNIFKDETFIKGDILDYKKLVSVMKKGFDAVVHLAAFKAAGESMIKPEKYSVNNITGTINILNAMCEAGIKNIVFSSSAAVFGEPEYLPIDEKHPTNPENYYGFTKLDIEYFLKWYDQLKGIRYSALRYFNAAGYDVKARITGLEINPANLLPIIMEVAAGIREQIDVYGDDYKTDDGTGVRDYIHVNDLASAHLKSLEYIVKENKSLLLNLGSETGISVLEMIKAAEEITGCKIKYKITGRRPGDSAKLVASSAKAKQIINWEAKYSDKETLIATAWEVYKKNYKITDKCGCGCGCGCSD